MPCALIRLGIAHGCRTGRVRFLGAEYHARTEATPRDPARPWAIRHVCSRVFATRALPRASRTSHRFGSPDAEQFGHERRGDLDPLPCRSGSAFESDKRHRRRQGPSYAARAFQGCGVTGSHKRTAASVELAAASYLPCYSRSFQRRRRRSPASGSTASRPGSGTMLWASAQSARKASLSSPATSDPLP